MFCVFSLKNDEKFKFLFGETHLKAKPANIKARVGQTKLLKEFFSKNYRNMPVFMAGDFNEEP